MGGASNLTTTPVTIHYWTPPFRSREMKRIAGPPLLGSANVSVKPTLGSSPKSSNIVHVTDSRQVPPTITPLEVLAPQEIES